MDKNLNKILDKFINIKEVEAIAIGGSTSAKTSDKKSDIDVYIFSAVDIPIEKRADIIKPISSKYEIGGEYFGAGDEFWVDEANVQLDIMYWNTSWFKNIFDSVWIKHYPSNGYTTCFLYTLKNFNIIYDKNNWLKNLQEKLNVEYPTELQNNIIKRNLMLMKDKPFASYYEQIEKAINRKDINSINHRISAFVASYFDVIFAINKQLHPGEKRLIDFALKKCKILPNNFEINLLKLFEQPNSDTLHILNSIVSELKLVIKSV
ncbi:MAG: DUF4037 domain-containing protein [Candidatus Gastranaerophilaceae bacterium]